MAGLLDDIEQEDEQLLTEDCNAAAFAPLLDLARASLEVRRLTVGSDESFADTQGLSAMAESFDNGSNSAGHAGMAPITSTLVRRSRTASMDTAQWDRPSKRHFASVAATLCDTHNIMGSDREDIINHSQVCRGATSYFLSPVFEAMHARKARTNYSSTPLS